MPTFKGIKCNRAKHLGWRCVKPGIDKNPNGTFKDERDKNCVAIVKQSDCNIIVKDGKQYYDPSTAPNIPAVNGSTWYAYGKTRTRKEHRWFYDDNGNLILIKQYFTTPFYAVNDGWVYQGTIRHYKPSLSYYLDEGKSYKEARKLVDEFVPFYA